MAKGCFIKITEKDEQFIRDNYLKMPIKTLARKINTSDGVVVRRLKKWNLTIPKEIKERNRNLGKFKKGHQPFNKGLKQNDYMSPETIESIKKTQFKKGHQPANTMYNGHERVTKYGYLEIRIKQGNYRLKHINEWENINGKLPKGHCLKCQDGNKLNTNPENWKLITRAENMYNNSHVNYPKEIIPSLVLVNKIKNKIKNK